MNRAEFYNAHCKLCGSQKCVGPRSEWIEGCAYRFELDEYERAAHERKPNLLELLEEINARTAQPSVEPDQTIGKEGTA